VERIRGDVRNREQAVEACRGVDVVFHVAAIAGIGGRWRDFYEANILGTRHILEGCRRHGVGRLVYTSSPSVTFDGTDQKGVNESAPYPARFMANYPRSKAIAEREVLAAGRSGETLTCALRPHLIWGPRDRHLIPRLLARARAGRLRRVGNGENLVDMIYVENAADAHLQAADALLENSPVAGSAYFLSQGEPVNCWRWIDQILALAGIPPVEKSISASAARRIGAVLETVYGLLGLKGEPPMTRFLAAQLSTHHFFDITRAREDFGYEPAVATDEGMRRLQAEIAGQASLVPPGAIS
ncbi:MAG: NAD-dependent epimerase/dehydratase family protein, partial [Thermoguttaceae bacterium]